MNGDQLNNDRMKLAAEHVCEHAKNRLKEKSSPVFDAAYEVGLSGTNRPHGLFINIEGMTPGEYKNGGRTLTINYSYSQSPFGRILVASTGTGICHMAFADGEEDAFRELRKLFPNADFHNVTDAIQQNAIAVFDQDWDNPEQIKLHIKGTDFQLKVWEVLLKIPFGRLCTYSDIAGKLDNPRACRAVGTAIGNNPVAFLIPCHRVIRSTGLLGGYRWGIPRKAAIIGWEAAKANV